MTSGVADLLSPFVAGAISIAAMLILLRRRDLPLDRPNPRSLHAIAVPRIGGIAVMAGVFAAAVLLLSDPAIVGPAVGLAVVSYIDDRRPLPPFVRLAAHLIAAAVLVWASGLSAHPVVAVALVLTLGWFTNLYNFMDGSDGLAGGMAVIGFTAYAIAAWPIGMSGLGPLALSIAASAAGFLMFNFPPARIFLGDVGSIPLGFLAGAIGVVGWRQGTWPAWFPVLVFAPFIVDTSMTLARRVLRGERVWQAHRQHYYQRLILSGWSHRKTALWEYALMLMCSAVAILCLRAAPAAQTVAIGILAAVFAIAMWAIDHRWRKYSAAVHD